MSQLDYLKPYIVYFETKYPNPNGLLPANALRRQRELDAIRAYFSFAPKLSPYPELSPNTVIDTSGPLPTVNPANQPDYNLSRLQDGLEWSSQRGYLNFMDLMRNLPDSPSRGIDDNIFRLLTATFDYPQFTQGVTRTEFDRFLATANAPQFSMMIMKTHPAQYDNVVSPLIPTPQDTLTLYKVFYLARLANRAEADWFGDRWNSSERAQDLLWNQLLARTNFSTIITSKSNQLDEDEFDYWLTSSRDLYTPESRMAIIENLGKFDEIREFIHLYAELDSTDSGEGWKSLEKELGLDTTDSEDGWKSLDKELGQVNAQTFRDIETQFAKPFANLVWLNKDSDGRDVNPDTLTAIYAVAAPWYQFEPGLLLYFNPEQQNVIEEFWAAYGVGISTVQQLYDAFQAWSKSPNDQSLTNQICTELASRLASKDKSDQARSQLVQLANSAIVEGVPLRFLFDNRLEKGFGSSAASINRLAAWSLRSSVWWFDTLQKWWDGICEKQLQQELYSIVQSEAPQSVRQMQFDADVLLADMLQAYIMNPNPRAVLRKIRKSDLSPAMRNHVEDVFKMMIQDRNVLLKLNKIKAGVITGQMNPAIADLEIQDLVSDFSVLNAPLF